MLHSKKQDLKNNLINMTIPETPNSPKQKYQLTPLGNEEMKKNFNSL